VLEHDANAWLGEPAGARSRPLHEDDGVLEVGLEITPVGGGDLGQAIEVEV
jgi:hypothetical protein